METYSIYEHFKEVADHSYRSVIQFWTVHQDRILSLPHEKYFDILFDYCDALFELGRYKEYIANVDELIDVSFQYNIIKWKDKDVLEHALFKKAAAHYQLFETSKSLHVLKELIRLKPKKKEAALLLQRCMMRQSGDKTQWWKKLTVILMLMSAIIVALELVVVAHYFPDYKFEVEMLRTFCFILGLFSWIFGESLQLFIIRSKCKQFIAKL